jgi:hypothetical protein
MSIENSASSSKQPLNSIPSSLDPETIAQLEKTALEIHTIAATNQQDPIALLQLLRRLEQIHRDIQQEYFQSALPNNRQALYALLRDIEESGGWPYIQRWKLQALLTNLPPQE